MFMNWLLFTSIVSVLLWLLMLLIALNIYWNQNIHLGKIFKKNSVFNNILELHAILVQKSVTDPKNLTQYVTDMVCFKSWLSSASQLIIDK